MRRTHRRAHGAFTLIELLVVIAIIIIIATVSLVLIQALTKGQAVKSAGRITQGAFAKARQLAAAQRVTHFLVFMNGTDTGNTGMVTGRMEVHRDVNRDNIFQPATDTLVDQPIPLPKGLRFYTRGAGGNPQPAPAHAGWLGFLSDGSITLDAPPNGSGFFPTDISSSNFDTAFGNQNPSTATSDLTIGSYVAAVPGKVYLDFTLPTGKLRKIVYWEN